MCKYIPNPDYDCRLCYHADKSEQYTKNDQIYCPVKKSCIDFGLCTDCGTECEDCDINPDLLKVDRLLRQGKEYQRTGDIGAFFRR